MYFADAEDQCKNRPEKRLFSLTYNAHNVVFLFHIMKFILGTKEKMTQFFAEDGNAYGATLITAGPIVVTQVKTTETDGYGAVQVGFGERREKLVKKPQKAMGNFRHVREFRVANPSDFAVGDSITIDKLFELGQEVTVVGTSKGKGFQGVVKRHGFAGGRRSHGQKHSEREPGSIGATGPQRVFKGTKMAGRMGSDRVTVKGLEILAIEPTTNTLLIKGAVPGRRGTLLEIVAK